MKRETINNIPKKETKTKGINTDKKGMQNHINDFTNSKEIGEDATQYGEFISSFFGWVSPEEQKEQVNKLENITKEK